MPALFTPRRTGNHQPQLRRSPLHLQCLPLLKLHQNLMSFRSCAAASRPPLLFQVVSRVVPLRDSSKVAHRAAVTGVPDDQCRLFWGLIVFYLFSQSAVSLRLVNDRVSFSCVVVSLTFYNTVVCFLFSSEQVSASACSRARHALFALLYVSGEVLCFAIFCSFKYKNV